jgi:DNA-binding NarL/FixJ family response regulator
MTSVLLVDDQDLVRAGLRALLISDPRITVMGEAADGRRGVDLAVQYRPDVVLMDIRMPRMDGIAATRAIRADDRLRSTRVVILTTFDDDADVVEAVRVGAAGYLLKDTPVPTCERRCTPLQPARTSCRPLLLGA